MIRRNTDGSITVGIIKEVDKGAANPAPASEKVTAEKAPRKPRKTTEN